MRTLLLLFAGWTSIAIGMVLLPLPTPLGVPLFLIGAALLLMVSPALRAWFKQWRGGHRPASEALERFERHLPKGLRDALDKTHPETGGELKEKRQG